MCKEALLRRLRNVVASLRDADPSVMLGLASRRDAATLVTVLSLLVAIASAQTVDTPPVPRVRLAERPSPADRNLLRPPATPSPANSSPAPPPAESAAPGVLTKEDVLQRIQLVQRETDLDEAVRADLVKRLQRAIELLAQADEAASRAAQFTSDIQQAPQLADEVASKLASSFAEAPVEPLAGDELSKIELRLSLLQTQLTEARDELAKRELEVKRRGERKAELAKSAAEHIQKIDEIRQQRAVPAAATEKPAVTLVRQTELDARQLLLVRQSDLAKIESQRIDAVIKLAPLQRDLAKRQVASLEKELQIWQKTVTDRRKADSVRQAEEARRQAQNAHPALRQLAERNAELAEKRRSMTASIEKVVEESQALNKQLTQLTSDFGRLQERINVAKMTRTNGILLRKQRADLKGVTAPHDRLRFIEEEMPAIQLALLEFEDERSLLADVETLVIDVDSKLSPDISSEDRAVVQCTASDLFALKRELLDKTIDDHNAYIKELSELEFSSRKLLEQTEQFTAFIDQHVLWIRSSEPLGHQDVRRAAMGLSNLFDARLWVSLGQKTFTGLWRRPLQGGAVLLLVLFLIVMRQRMWNRLQKLCQVDSGNSALHFLPTLEALLLVVMGSSVWPCLMWCAGWWLESSYQVDEFSNAIAAGLQRGALFWLLLQLVRNSTSASGIGESHFGWYPSGTRVVRENLLWLGAIGIPIAIAVTVVGEMEDGQWNDSLGRFAFMAGMVLTATAMHHIFRLQKGMFHEALVRAPQSWLNRVRIGGHLTGTGIPCALAVLAAAGYYYSARQLAIRFELTMLIALVLCFAHGVASRWFLVKRRNLSIKQARERRNTQAESTSSDNKAPIAPTTNLSTIQSQLQVLLRYIVVLAVLIVAWYVWADVLPALLILDRFVLWTSTDTSTTLTHGLLAFLFAIGTVVMGKNLPALLEITVLERLPIDHGGRHAAAIIFRYIVYVSGLLLVARTLNMSWSSVQWLAAAITVGLGFGLQEIFANLVSGLIILFERPIRVGDLVTVNGVTGTVTRMQIRATTITDSDRRELIVPNKKFITEDVINWTLTDPISRITIDVGISYGSDTALAHSLLEKVAREHPLVMTDPAPGAIFKRFGESTLDFSLYVFISSRDVYGVVLHELHTAIDREFRKVNLEIAYPQRDVNIRSISNSALPMMTEIGKAKAA
jgi:potassium efflux system protein